MKRDGIVHLHVRSGENTGSPVVLSFKPVSVDLPVDVNDVAFLQRQLSEGIEKKRQLLHTTVLVYFQDSCRKLVIYRIINSLGGLSLEVKLGSCRFHLEKQKISLIL